MYEGIEVKHTAWGKGIIKSIVGGYITVDFDGNEKTLIFPDSIGKYLSTTNERLLKYAEQELALKNKKLEEEKKAAQERIAERIVTRGVIKGDGSDYETPLLGRRSEDIAFSSEEAFYEAIGYLAKPGRIAFYQAELPEDREKQFKTLFPGQDYKVIKTSYGKSGMTTKQGCQFRINLADISNCPESLLRHISEKNGNWAGRINRSKFALRLVHKNGFSFGHFQNVDIIKSKVPSRYIDAFNKGYRR